MTDIATNIEAVNRRIGAAANRAGREANEITLVTVTKTQPLETVIEAYQAGLRHFGENRAKEGLEKVAGLAEWLKSTQDQEKPAWHLIGHLQSRQVANVLGHFSLIHSVDSLKLAQRINRLVERDNHEPVQVLLQCNVSGEATKSGFALDNWASDTEQLTAFLEVITQVTALNKIIIRGLMTMAPLVNDPEEVRPVFQNLALLKTTLQRETPQIDWSHLSMGMTDDFEVAIEEGATMIRVGRALFGER